MHRTLIVFGTRPEIIKLGPVYQEFCRRKDVEVETCWTGQHIDLADGLLELFDIGITHTTASALDIIALPSLSEKLGRMVSYIGNILKHGDYQSVVVQGDTLSALAGAQAAFLENVPLAHVEAGLRTFDLKAPWPEEYARRVISVGADYHFPPTSAAQNNLLREKVEPSRVFLTGNTVVDALQFVEQKVCNGFVPHDSAIGNLPQDKKIILVTGHRRENFGEPMRRVLEGIRTLAEDDDKFLVFPVHPNPAVRKAVQAELGDLPNLLITRPLRYPDLVYVLSKAWTVITDSGGIQEEAPTFGIPVVITREVTERPEVVSSGFGLLVGTDAEAIVHTVRYLTSRSSKPKIDVANPFGDGLAARRIAYRMFDNDKTEQSAPAVFKRPFTANSELVA